MGGAYDSSKQATSLPKNKIGLPESVQKQIYKKVSAGLGYNISPDVKISGFIDRERVTGGKGRNTKTVQLSGNMKGNRFVGAISDRDGERVGSFSLVVPLHMEGKSSLEEEKQTTDISHDTRLSPVCFRRRRG